MYEFFCLTDLNEFERKEVSDVGGMEYSLILDNECDPCDCNPDIFD